MLYNIALYIHNALCYGRKNDGPNQDSNPDFLAPALDWFLIPPPQMIFALDYLSMLFSLAEVNQFQG